MYRDKFTNCHFYDQQLVNPHDDDDWVVDPDQGLHAHPEVNKRPPHMEEYFRRMETERKMTLELVQAKNFDRTWASAIKTPSTYVYFTPNSAMGHRPR